jgi:hypothetical protein
MTRRAGRAKSHHPSLKIQGSRTPHHLLNLFPYPRTSSFSSFSFLPMIYHGPLGGENPTCNKDPAVLDSCQQYSLVKGLDKRFEVGWVVGRNQAGEEWVYSCICSSYPDHRGIPVHLASAKTGSQLILSIKKTRNRAREVLICQKC